MRRNNPLLLSGWFLSIMARYHAQNTGTRIRKTIGWIAIIFGLAYVSLVLFLSPIRSLSIPFFFPIGLGIVVFWGVSYLSRFSLTKSAPNEAWVPLWGVFISIALFYLLLAAFCAFESPDTQWQWRQATGVEPFDDWHPVLHTFLIHLVTAFLKSYRFTVMIQALLLAGLLTWLYGTFRKYRYNRVASIFVIILTATNPFSLSLVRILWKDTAFAMTGLALSICGIHILETRGAWLRCRWHLLSMSMLLFLASFLRHNGFFFTLPLAVLLPFSVARKNVSRVFSLLACSLLLSVGYLVLRWHLTDLGTIVVNRPAQGFSEAVGLPMSILSECYVRHPEKVPSDVAAFLGSLGDRDFWEDHYAGDFNSVKFACTRKGLDTRERIEKLGRSRFFDMLARTIRANPSSSVKVFLRITAIAWDPFPEDITGCVCLTNQRIPIGADIDLFQTLLARSPAGPLLLAPGAYLLYIVLVFSCGVFRLGLSCCFLALPFLCYQFGTMLFLSGHDYRFFFITVLSGGAVCLAMLTRRENMNPSEV